mmetsp:Transcript_32099/g.73391  ORF Transcript_32099/g.73391 Transcript_32099/m.73391 type:complete len:155 (+) Transcript_32099:881-1345(+)
MDGQRLRKCLRKVPPQEATTHTLVVHAIHHRLAWVEWAMGVDMEAAHMEAVATEDVVDQMACMDRWIRGAEVAWEVVVAAVAMALCGLLMAKAAMAAVRRIHTHHGHQWRLQDNSGKYGFIAQDGDEASMFVLLGACVACGGTLPQVGTRVCHM